MTDETNYSLQLPRGWTWTTLEDILLSLESGGRPKGGVRNIKHGVPSIGGEHLLYNGGFDFGNLRYVPKEFYEKMTRGKILKRDVLVVKDGATTGKTAFVSDTFPFPEAAVNEHVFILRVFERFTEPKYLFFWMQSCSGQNCVKENFQGTAQGGINSYFVKNSKFPFPPLSEQHRIVARLEELFTRLDTGVEGLQKVKGQLKRYRQAVLKYAFEGQLTEKWRKTCRDQIEPATKLEKARHESIGLLHSFGLPEEWILSRLDLCSSLITKGESPNWQGFDYVDSGVPFIRSENVLWGTVDLENTVKIPIEFHNKLKRSQIKAGDVLVNLVGASIGRCGIVPSFVETANINQAVALIRVNDFLRSSYLMYLLLSPKMQNVIHSSKVETARPNISLQDLRQLAIPLPSLAEQHKIVEEIEWRFSVIEDAEKATEKGLKLSERLRESTLKMAFEGKLVPQDPSDGPADKLLERIKVERAKSKAEKDISKKKIKPKQLELSTYVE